MTIWEYQIKYIYRCVLVLVYARWHHQTRIFLKSETYEKVSEHFANHPTISITSIEINTPNSPFVGKYLGEGGKHWFQFMIFPPDNKSGILVEIGRSYDDIVNYVYSMCAAASNDKSHDEL